MYNETVHVQCGVYQHAIKSDMLVYIHVFSMALQVITRGY